MIRALIALLASVLAGTQIYFIMTTGQGLCFNDGCEIVERLTRVSPLYINIAGLIYFQLLFWLFLSGRNGLEYWHKLARLLLLSGLAVEAVLVFFQYEIAGAFCSYCLIIFSCVALLTVLCGLRQIFRGAVVFSAVMVACFSLQFQGSGGIGGTLEEGSMAVVNEGGGERVAYLFFSASCPHCEKVIDSLRENNSCAIRFNPIEPMDNFSFPGARKMGVYNPQINVSFLKNQSITKIPVLVVNEPSAMTILRGETRISEYLSAQCQSKGVRDVVEDYSGTTSSVVDGGYGYVNMTVKKEDDGCVVAADCKEDSQVVTPSAD